jgi:hypothetical protein
MPDYDVTLTPDFQKIDEWQAIESAQAIIEGASYTVAQAIANTSNDVKAWLPDRINSLPGMSGTGITVSESNITLAGSFTAAVAGSAATPAGSDGSFTFNVSLTKGTYSQTTADLPGTIAATSQMSHTVTIGSHDNGSITVNPSAPSAAGTQITLTVTPDAGYETVSVSAYKTGDASTVVTLTNQYTFTMPDHDVTVTAVFQKTQAQIDEETVEEAKVDIEGGTFRITQTMGNTEDTVKDWLINTLKILFEDVHGVQFRSATIPILGDVTLTSLIPAIEGTEESPEGTNGSYLFTVTLMRGATVLTAGTVEGIILAMPYAGTPLKRIELMNMGSLKLRLVNTGNTPTGDLALTLSGPNAEAFILPSPTISSLPAGIETDFELALSAGLPKGIYHATLTVSCEGITPVSADIAYTVISTANDNPQENSLKAWMQNGRLHISGLTAGELWRVYNFSGSLIYHGIAGDEEENIDLSVRGLYVVVSGRQTVKVIFK